MTYKSNTIKSKWIKHNWLLQHPSLRKHVPRTMLFNQKNLSTMLSAYSTVFFKPTGGSGGFRIIRIKKIKQGYQTQHNSTKTTYSTIEQLYDKLLHFSAKQSFLLQKGISLAKTNDRPFDIRVMVQKTNEGKWVSTALFTKIGKSGMVATNYNQGGTIGYFHQTLQRAGYPSDKSENMAAALEKMGVSVGQCFDRHISGLRELGLDVALDDKGRLWILEVNTRPQFYPLKHMSNQKLYKRIISYAKQYGRTK